MKKMLFVFRHSPYQSNLTKDGFDVLFTAASFEQPLSVLFIDEGVWALKSQQNASAISRRNLEKQLKAFSLYDIEEIYVDTDSLRQRNLDAAELPLQAKLVNKNEVSALLHSHKHLLSF